MANPKQQQLVSLQDEINWITQELAEETRVSSTITRDCGDEWQLGPNLQGFGSRYPGTGESKWNYRGTEEKELELEKPKNKNEDIEDLKKRNEDLESELSTLKEVVALQKPLAENAVFVRRQLFKQAKRQRGHDDVIDSIIHAGNRAAHRGDWFADLAMFKLGYMKKPDLVVDPSGIKTKFEALYKNVFDDLYGYPVESLW